jgi:hypothetical protein
MLVVVLLLPLSLAMDDGEFEDGGGGGGGGSGGPAQRQWRQWRRWMTIGSKSGQQQEH